MDKTDIKSKLLAACVQAGPRFTMREVLEHLTRVGSFQGSEDSLLISFSDAWVDLMQAQVIVQASGEEPEEYELAPDRT